MKVFKNIGLRKVLICLSIGLNVVLLCGIILAERSSHVFENALRRHGIISGVVLPPDYWARVGWTNTIEKLHTEFDVAFFGNSITRGSDFQLAFPDKKIINIGYSGDDILGMQNRISMIKNAHPQKVFIMAGTNDLINISLDEYNERYSKLISSIQDSIPGVKIYIQSVLPSNHEMGKYAPNRKVREANEIARAISESHNCTYIDLFSLYADENDELPRELTRDGVHLYPQSYDRWADKIRPYIYE